MEQCKISKEMEKVSTRGLIIRLQVYKVNGSTYLFFPPKFSFLSNGVIRLSTVYIYSTRCTSLITSRFTPGEIFSRDRKYPAICERMPRKGMRSICFNSRTLSSTGDSVSTTRRRSVFSESMIDQNIESAAEIIMKWNPDSSSYARVTSMFYEDKNEAMKFIKCTNDLQKAMQSLASDVSGSEKLVYAQGLMQIAMKRLQKEFYQILSMNRAHLDPESVSARSSRCSARSSVSDYDDSDEIRVVGTSISEVEEVSSIAMADRLGIEKTSSSQIIKMAWDVLDFRIKNWLEAIKIAMRTLFNGERILCDHVFAGSEPIRESIFTDISRDGASLLFKFPELVAKSKKSPQKVFRLLDMYTAIAENWEDMETIFSFESTSVVRSQALTSLAKLGESVRVIVSDFESSIHKDHSKLLVAGGGVHDLTINEMNYLSLLGDYSVVLTDIFADWISLEKSSLPDSYFDGPDFDDSSKTSVSLRMAWLILVLLCKLDRKAENYKDVSSSYIFLANNLQYVVSKVRSSNLQNVLGDDWIAKHEAKVKQFAVNYERLAWGGVFSSLPENPTAKRSEAEGKKLIRNFNLAFEQAFRKQSSNVILDSKLRDEIKVSIARKIVPAYRDLFNSLKSLVRSERTPETHAKFTPEDIGHYLSDLFFGPNSSGSTSSSSTSSSRQRHLG